MKRILTLLSIIFVAIEAESDKNPMKFNSNHVNLSLETAFIFDPQDSYHDISLIRTLRSFLDTLQDAITSKAKLRTRPKDHYAFSDFIYELGGYFIKYSDENVKAFTISLQNVIEDYYPSGTVYHKIIYDPRLKAFIKNSIKDWVATDPKVLKKSLKAMYDQPTYNETFVHLAQTLNTFYDKEDCEKLKKYAKKFETFPSKQKKLEAIIDKTLNHVIFDRYEMLNYSMKSVLVEELSKVAEYVMVAFNNRSVDPEFLIRKRTFSNMTLQELLTPQDSQSDTAPNPRDFSGSDREDFPINPNDSLEKITKTSEEDNASKNDIEQEIVLDKVLEINVNQNEGGNQINIEKRKHLDKNDEVESNEKSNVNFRYNRDSA